MPRPKANEEQVIDLLRSRTMVGEVFDELFYMRANPNRAVYPSWQLDRFDQLMGGIPPAFIVLVAKQKFGKSFFMQHLLRQTEKAGKRNLIISLEMDEFMLGCRILASEAGVPLSKFTRPANMNDEEWNCVIEAKARIEEFNAIWNYDTRTIPAIERIVQAIDPEYVYLDYVGLMSGKGRNRNEELGDIAAMLKIISKAKPEGDEKRARYELLMALVEQHTWLIGQEYVDKLKVNFGTRWDAYLQQAADQPEDHRPRLRRGIFTPSQTSKEQQRKGELDETAPKDSQALFESCDLGLVGNMVETVGAAYAPNIRKIKIAVSRICQGGDEINIGINPSLGLVWDFDRYGANAPKTNIGARF